MNGHSEDKFGEKRPAKRDEWGNDYRPASVPMPFKVEKACDPKVCRDHVTIIYSVEQDMPSVSNPMEMLQMMMTGQEIPVAKQWVPIIRVLNGYN